MRLANAAALAILFLLVPHQEPRADSADAAPVVDDVDNEDRAVGRPVRQSDGYVWSRQESVAPPAPALASEHLATDGYSWSARSSETALDAMR